MTTLRLLICRLLRIPTGLRLWMHDPELVDARRRSSQIAVRLRRLELEVLTIGRRDDDYLND